MCLHTPLVEVMSEHQPDSPRPGLKILGQHLSKLKSCLPAASWPCVKCRARVVGAERMLKWICKGGALMSAGMQAIAAPRQFKTMGCSGK